MTKFTKQRRTKKARSTKNDGWNRVSIRRNPISKSAQVQMRYVTQINLNPTSLTSANWIFNASGVYDPDTTGIGHQPLGFDQWMLFYDHYVVVGSKISVEFITEASDAYVVAIGLRDQAAPTTDPELFRERGHTVYATANGTQKSTKLVKGYSPRKFFAVDDIVSKDTLRGSVTTNPAENAYYIVNASAGTSVDPGAITAHVTLQYTVLLTEPKPLAQS